MDSNNRKPPTEASRLELSEEVLKELLTIFRDAKKPTEKPNKEKEVRKSRVPFRWYEVTSPGVDPATIALPDSRSSSPASDLSLDRGLERLPDDDDGDSLRAIERWPELEIGHDIYSLNPNRGWNLAYVSPFYGLEKGMDSISSLLVEATGDLWRVPSDGRISLRVTPNGLGLHPEAPGVQQSEVNINRSRDFLERLKGFDSEFSRLNRQSGTRGFYIWDYQPWSQDKMRLEYRTSRRRGNLFFEPYPDWIEYLDNITNHWGKRSNPFIYPSNIWREHWRKFDAPWRRLIQIQGLASMSDADFHIIDNLRCPYLQGPGEYPHYDDHTPAREAIEYHLKCARVPGSMSGNPYMREQAFHITFFQRIEDKRLYSKESLWKIGNLIDPITALPTEQLFGQSAFTVLVRSMPVESPWDLDNLKHHYGPLHPLYTVLLLTPQKTLQYCEWETVLRKGTMVEAELWIMAKGLEQVVEEWATLNVYLDTLLQDNFMHPTEYSKALFDDENLTLSRKYFWAIGCLASFITNISDNIKQLQLHHEARIKPLLELDDLADWLDASILKKENKQTEQKPGGRLTEFHQGVQRVMALKESLVELRVGFRDKLERFQSLRDGLFNASALLESRASTRLGHNVKLLTYVSIFYLPLAFCASLWAIPNIEEISTKRPFIITTILVGFVTYLVVFNLDHTTRKLKHAYFQRREKLLRKMQDDEGDGWWKDNAKRFRSFGAPEDTTPTEWWIIPFFFRGLFTRVFWVSAENEQSAKATSENEATEGIALDNISISDSPGADSCPVSAAEKEPLTSSEGAFSLFRRGSTMKSSYSAATEEDLGASEKSIFSRYRSGSPLQSSYAKEEPIASSKGLFSRFRRATKESKRKEVPVEV